MATMATKGVKRDHDAREDVNVDLKGQCGNQCCKQGQGARVPDKISRGFAWDGTRVELKLTSEVSAEHQKHSASAATRVASGAWDGTRAELKLTGMG